MATPEAPVETDSPTVKMIRAVVGGKLVCGAIKLELSFSDSIAVSTDYGSKVGRFVKILLGIIFVVRVESEYHVVERTVSVRDSET